MKNSIKLISVVGPTASGKTRLAVELAKIAWAGNANEAQLEVEAGKRSE